jgi:hypothetical protein
VRKSSTGSGRWVPDPQPGVKAGTGPVPWDLYAQIDMTAESPDHYSPWLALVRAAEVTWGYRIVNPAYDRRLATPGHLL